MAGTRPSRSSSASKSETGNGGKARGGSMPTRKAEAEWKGNLAEGSGRLRVGSGAFDGPYSFKSRFEEGQAATNPEELIGAAHAGCFTMALTAQLSRAGLAPARVQTGAKVTLRSEEHTSELQSHHDLVCR